MSKSPLVLHAEDEIRSPFVARLTNFVWAVLSWTVAFGSVLVVAGLRNQ